MRSPALCLLTVLLFGSPVWADSLVHNGKTYDNVYVREGNSSYYIQDPATGTVTAVPKAEVDAGDVVITSDVTLRQSLLNQWKAAKADKPMPALTTVAQSALTAAAVSAQPANPAPADPVPAGRASAASGNASVRLNNVPLRDALRVTLRSQNLDYTVRDNYVYVSTPTRLRHEPLEQTESRAYSVAGATASDTLPKIVVRNPAAVYGQTGYGGGYGGGGMRTGGYGMGGGMGMQGGGMGMGGYRGGMGMQGGMGMGGYGGGMGMGMRGGMMGGYGGGQHFSNISDLFFNIDDRLVGETPAVIGVGGLSTVQRPPQR